MKMKVGSAVMGAVIIIYSLREMKRHSSLLGLARNDIARRRAATDANRCHDVLTQSTPKSDAALKDARREAENFIGGYQTVVAIIQGVAFGALIVTAQAAILGNSSVSHKLAIVMRAVVILTAVIVVTDEYLQLTRAAYWTPRLADTIIPYVLGTAEVAAATSIGSGAWWWGCVSFLLLFGGMAFRHSYRRANPARFQETHAYSHFRRAVRILSTSCFLTFPCALAMNLVSVFAPGTLVQVLAPPILLICFVLTSIVLLLRSRGSHEHGPQSMADG
jgi:hypothetical protein